MNNDTGRRDSGKIPGNDSGRAGRMLRGGEGRTVGDKILRLLDRLRAWIRLWLCVALVPIVIFLVGANLNSVIRWTPPALNEDGSAITDLDGYVFAVVPQGVDLRIPGTAPLQTVDLRDPPSCPGDTCEIPARDLFEGLEEGQSYLVFVQSYDTSGNRSKWSAPSNVFSFDSVSPEAATNVRVETPGASIVEIRITPR